eukprot:GGOE01038146.1.p1 GENE.GGOE01038146.1~~GGOE01038146.1.p1  ORF type:complete len:246 (-),score=50.30 GGOE01038146.1:149-886(-)
MSWQLQRWLFRAKESDINRPLYSVKDVPDTFTSDKEYFETLLSHVAEELRAQIHASLPNAHSSLVELNIDDYSDKKKDLYLRCSCTTTFQPADVLLLCQDYPWAETTELNRTKHRFSAPMLFGIVDTVRPNGQLEVKVGAEQEPKVQDVWQWWCMKVTSFAPLRRVADALHCGLQAPHMLDYLSEDLYIGNSQDGCVHLRSPAKARRCVLPGSRPFRQSIVKRAHRSLFLRGTSSTKAPDWSMCC